MRVLGRGVDAELVPSRVRPAVRWRTVQRSPPVSHFLRLSWPLGLALSATLLMPATLTVGEHPQALHFGSYATLPAQQFQRVGLYHGSWIPLDDSVYRNSSLPRGWIDWSNGTSPPTRENPSLAYDPAEGGVVMFGGGDYASGSLLNDTWLFSNGSWDELCSGTSQAPTCPLAPGIRQEAPMAYDGRDGELVLYGGTNGASTDLTDTWIFKSATWSNVTATAGNPPPAGPAAASVPDGCMAYDPAAGYVVYLDPDGSTYAFANDTWGRISLATSPGSMLGEAMFYDALSGSIILWGGSSSNTWSFSAGNWTELSPSSHPPGDSPDGYGYDAAFGYGFVVGPQGFGSNSTWVWQNGTWANASTELSAPATGLAAAVAYDAAGGYSVEFTETGYLASDRATWLLTDPLTLTETASAGVRDVGQSSFYNITVDGGVPPLDWGSSHLPPGCPSLPANFSEENATCLLTAPGSFGSYLNVTDLAGVSVSLVVPLVVNPDPTANTTILPNPTTVGVPIRFSTEVTGGTAPFTYLWLFDDSSSSDLSVVNHTYLGAGNYLAQLTVTDAAGWSLTSGVVIVVNPFPTITVSSSSTITDVGIPLWLNASGIGGTPPLTYAWQFGDGSGSQLQSVTHSYAEAGTFYPTAWANDSRGESSTGTTRVVVDPALGVSAIANTTSTWTNSTVSFSSVTAGGTAPFTFWWDFGSKGESHAQNATFAFPTAGTYNVTLVANDSAGASRAAHVNVTVLVPRGSSPGGTGNQTSAGLSLPILVAVGVASAAVIVAVGVVVIRARRKRPPADSP